MLRRNLDFDFGFKIKSVTCSCRGLYDYVVNMELTNFDDLVVTRSLVATDVYAVWL